MAVARSDDGSGNSTRRRPLRKPLGSTVATGESAGAAAPAAPLPVSASPLAPARLIPPPGMRLDDLYRLPMPKLFMIPQAAPNAFATGRNPSHASVAVTQGLMEIMNDDELEGVIAHELSHVRNYDILTSSIAATSVRVWPRGRDLACRLSFSARRYGTE